MEYNEFKQEVVLAAIAAGIKEYELYYRTDTDMSVEVMKKAVKSFSNSESGGVCFRCIVNGKMGYAATELLTKEEAQNMVERAVDNAVSIESEEEVFLYGGKDVYQSVDNRVKELSTEELIHTAICCNEETYTQDERVVDGSEAEAFQGKSTISIYNSKGLNLTNTTSMCGLVNVAVVSNGNEMTNAIEIQVGNPETFDRDKITKEAVSLAVDQLAAGKVTSGKKKIVLSGKMMATMIQTFSSVFSAEYAQKGLSLYQGKESQVVASKELTLIDDPCYEGSTMKMPFDAEGVATFKKDIIQDGVLVTLFHNLKTANVAQCKSTGNASKPSYDSNVDIRPFSFYVKPGTMTRDEVFAFVKEGLYITDLQGMHASADASTGDFSLAAGGYLIAEGKKAGFVKGFTIAGNFYEMLKRIECVGNDLEFGIPRGTTCMGSPSVVISELSVAGE